MMFNVLHFFLFCQRHADIIAEAEELDEVTCLSIERLWNNRVIQQVWENRSTFQVDSAGNQYVIHSSHSFLILTHLVSFLDNCRRFAEEDYVPTTDDILRSRMKTAGVIELKLEIDGMEVIIVDVGGQRNERRKWIHCFDDVTAVIYLTALDECKLKCPLPEAFSSNDLFQMI